MLKHPDDFYRAIGLGIDAENRKASVYITHGASLGTAREIILRDVMQDATPAPFRLSGGIIHGSNGKEVTNSRQCDVLVYDPTINPPKYAFRDFAIVDPETAKLVVEVKSNLNEETFGESMCVTESIHKFYIPTLCFAYESVAFNTFSDYFAEAVIRPCKIPYCVAVHSKDFLAIRPFATPTKDDKFILVVNCSAAPSDDLYSGFATAMFLQIYDAFLRNRDILSSKHIYQWFNGLTCLPNEALIRIAEDGKKHEGPI